MDQNWIVRKTEQATLIRLNSGVVLPLAAYAVALDLERRGCELVVDGDDVLIGPSTRITAEDRRDIREFRPFLRLILAPRDAAVR